MKNADPDAAKKSAKVQPAQNADSQVPEKSAKEQPAQNADQQELKSQQKSNLPKMLISKRQKSINFRNNKFTVDNWNKMF